MICVVPPPLHVYVVYPEPASIAILSPQPYVVSGNVMEALPTIALTRARLLGHATVEAIGTSGGVIEILNLFAISFSTTRLVFESSVLLVTKYSKISTSDVSFRPPAQPLN